MKPHTPDNSKGRAVGGHDIHHRTADQPKSMANRSAKAMRHAARQDGRRIAQAGIGADADEPAVSDAAADEKVTVTLELSPRAALLLRIVGDAYLTSGSPAWECAQDWSEEFTVPELAELEGAIEAATAGLDRRPKP